MNKTKREIALIREAEKRAVKNFKRSHHIVLTVNGRTVRHTTLEHAELINFMINNHIPAVLEVRV